MRAASLLRSARRRAGLTQRALAERAGVPQSTVGRIETGAIDPRATTLQSLLRACGYDLEAEPLLGVGVDRTQIRESLKRPTPERVAYAVAAAHALARIRGSARRGARR
jgi:transcriptional regulator with XRE-family HTH domain